MSDQGASNNERLLYAARTDDEETLLGILNKNGSFDINCVDGLGNTALHYVAKNGSLVALEHVLCCDNCDVDPQNRIDRATPLHLALFLKDSDLRYAVFESLLDAGANTRIKDKRGDTVLDLLGSKDGRLRMLIRKSQAQTNISQADIARDDEGGASDSGSE